MKCLNAESFDYGKAKYDLIIFGGCLFEFDPTKLFNVFAAADKALLDRGNIFIWDLLSIGPLRRPYKHEKDTVIHKLDFLKFLASPYYRLECYRAYGLDGPIDDAHFCATLKKSSQKCFSFC